MLNFTLIMVAIAAMFLMVAMTIDGILIGDSQGVKKEENIPLWKKIFPFEVWIIIAVAIGAIAMIVKTERSLEWVILLGYPLTVFVGNFVADVFDCPRQGDKLIAIVSGIALLAMAMNKIGFINVPFDETSLVLAVSLLFVLPRMARSL